MTPRQVVERFWAAVGRNDFAAAGALLADDYLLEWPQSGERIRGRDHFIAINENYPAVGPWRTEVHRVVADGSWVASDVTVTDGSTTGRAITFSEVVDGKITRQTEFWPDPFEPALWRRRWVEVEP